MASTYRLGPARGVLPWFRRWPCATLPVAAALFGAVVLWQVLGGGGADQAAVLFCLPVALLAVTFGMRAGLAAGVVGVGLVLLSAGWDQVALSEVLAILLLGGLLGHAVDTLHAAERHNRRLTEITRRHREAVELNDTVVQGLAAAKWALEGGRNERGLQVVCDTLDTAQKLVSDLLHDADMGPRFDDAHHDLPAAGPSSQARSA